MTKEQTYGIYFALATALFWGLYGIALQKARVPGDPSPFKPFIFIGLAYLVWGVFGGALAIKATGGTFAFQPLGIQWAFIAGSLGAAGALTLTAAMFQAKSAALVMPIVFGGATAVSVITTMLMLRAGGTAVHVHPLQLLGFVLAIVGIILIQRYAQHAGPKPAAAPTTEQTAPKH